MEYALLTALCWSFGGFASSRIARHYGATRANALRLTLATSFLFLIALAMGQLSVPAGLIWFMLSGFLHLTVGDVALFAVYRRLGPRLGVLMVSSLAPPIALLTEFGMLGTTLRAQQMLLALGVLICVALAVAPRERAHLSRAELIVGLIAGLFAAVGQGMGAACNRMGYGVAREAGVVLSPWLPAFWRVAAGGAGVGLWFLFLYARKSSALARPTDFIAHRRIGGPPWVWLLVSTLMGTVVGMAFLMKAFETAPAGLVQAILATLPVLMIPLAWFFDGNRPSKRSAFAGLGAVGLTVWMIVRG